MQPLKSQGLGKEAVFELRDQIRPLIIEFCKRMAEPCHTSAYKAAHDLNESLRRLMAEYPYSDYGYAGFLMDAFRDGIAAHDEAIKPFLGPDGKKHL